MGINFSMEIFFFLIYLLITYYYLDLNKKELINIFPIISRFFLLTSFFFVLINVSDLQLIEQEDSGACSLLTNLSSLKFKFLNENSHFGMVAPAAIFCFFFSIKQNEFFKLNNIIFYFIVIFLCITLYSMTLLLGLVISLIALLFSINKKNYTLFIIPLILVLISISVISVKKNCSSRIDRINLLESIKIMELQEKNYFLFSQATTQLNKINNQCDYFNFYIDIIDQKNQEINILNKEINFNQKKIDTFSNATDELFALQMKTKILIDQKTQKIQKLVDLIILKLATTKVKENCDNLKITEKFKKKIEELNKNNKILENKSNAIAAEDAKYANPNITTQVYQIALFNTYSSIKENPFGWGYNNYKFAHFRYSLKNMLKLNIFVDNNLQSKKQKKNTFDDESNITDPDVLYLNYNDGRNNFSKLFIEFGYFTLILFIFLFIFGISKKINLIAKAFLLSIICTQLGSGAGYINGGFIIAILLTLIIYLDSFSKKI